ncbi:hypothetical protein HJG54_07520 [Leptolyngbya sp. NK1-12]|uniref:Uncharacterized protein n=1 Tax=Leptolyngbya sp. NK1-12 TaxID=2547451 RepID=A0AA96WCQ8_9CYAN|nr:hypothetical protein [Leptolyngbya sp. NK1-12]WNZ22719.1 hypothetical protein HJG54_07520 [Leptolyngbya sp. NK1-12]
MNPILTAKDIRHARAIDLARLTGIDASNFAAWSNHRHISKRNLGIIATALGMEKSEVLRGFELRRHDNRTAQTVAAKLARATSPQEQPS